MFPTLVLGPQSPGTSSSNVKTEVITRLDLWRRGLLDELDLRSKVQARARSTIQPSKTARAARRAARLIYKHQFTGAADLSGSLGIADATPDTSESLRHVFPESSSVPEADLLDYYGQDAPPILDIQHVTVDLETLKSCLASSPPLSPPHKCGWRVEHITSLSASPTCGEALAALMMTSLIKGEVSNKIADLLSSAALVVLLKKDAESVVEMKILQGDAICSHKGS